MCKLVLDVECYDPADNAWAQAHFLVHGRDDVLWTDDPSQVAKYVEEDCYRFLEIAPPILRRSTGRFDSNGTEVFEGDILRVPRRTDLTGCRIPLTPFSDFVVEWDADYAGFAPFCYRGYDGEEFCDGSGDGTFTVIGQVNQTVSPTPDPTSA